MPGAESDLVLAGHRVRVVAEDSGLLNDALSVLVPPCSEVPVSGAEADWRVEIGVTDAEFSGLPELGRPALSWPDSGTRLTILDAVDGVTTLAARYRADSPAALVTVDRPRGRTQILIPGSDPASRRWTDWVVRAFFGPRLLADGWMLLHAAAVRVMTSDGGRALLVMAGPRGGKSTIAHRACTELGTQFMADDLVLLRPGPAGCPSVIGWPTRVCLPSELLDQALLDASPRPSSARTDVAGGQRRRLILSPPEYQRLAGVMRAEPGPVRVGGVLAVLSGEPDGKAPPGRCLLLGDEQLAAAMAGAGQVPAQRLRMLDMLGVAGNPATAIAGTPGHPASWRSVLSGVPVAGLGLTDMSLLPQLRIWDLLDDCLPWLREAGS